MPELPEAETIAADLRARVTGALILSVDVLRPDILAPGLEPAKLAAAVAGRRIESVGRRAKNVLLLLAGDRRVLVNLGMTGRLVVDDAPAAALLRHIALRFQLEDGRAILYDDARRFGRIEVHDATTWAQRDRTLGIEPLSEAFTPERLLLLTRASRSPIRNWLLDQTRVAGIGNIYASEALYRARIRPTRPANRLRPIEARRLHDALQAVLRESIAARGTTLLDYRDGSGVAGGFEPLLRVYDRAGSPCPACGTAIRRGVLTNRSYFYCPRCQR
jgi:formamidopyrimidine-DNA glycosylase